MWEASQLKSVFAVVGAVEGVGDALIDRHSDRVRGRIVVEAGMKGDRFAAHVLKLFRNRGVETLSARLGPDLTVPERDDSLRDLVKGENFDKS
ncbi:hypothetical protein MetexDRAFT_6835 [Methylorubrum extorquens DSM 13060]|uniref:Uncharacterized protein n=1 Tax=Methylorubrum extorquens DSM 13060 TaxID=882800 RepID=H1KW22_METEX|nr:hypothetical protein MetexDRAFT_6835 [Methylorubrum extorquens DSM 13060]